MRRSTDRILTTHVGALPAPDDVWAQLEVSDQRLGEAVTEVCDMQTSAGVDFINEGELTKGGHWTQYLAARLGGYEPAAERGGLGKLLMSSADWVDFDEFYLAVLQNGTLFEQSGSAPHVPEGAEDSIAFVEDWVCTGPITFRGQQALDREIAMLKAALGDRPASDAFLTTTAPLSVEPGRANEFYKSDEEHIYAIAEAMQVEYEAIAAAGFQVQVDDAWLGALWDRIGLEMGIDGYRKFCQMRCEALNHALRNIPEEQIRYHLCWGSWHGPHSRDLPLPDVIDIMLSVKAQTYLDRGRQRAPRARGGAVGGHQAARRQDPRPGRRDPLDAAHRASATRSGSHPALRRGSSDARTSSPPPTAGSACAAIRRSRGPSSRRSPTAPRSRRLLCGVEGRRHAGNGALRSATMRSTCTSNAA